MDSAANTNRSKESNMDTIDSWYTDGPQRIRMRLKPCQCGCNGADSWHRSVFTRVVRDVRPCVDPSSNRIVHAIARGVVKFPWGEQGVELHALKDSGLVIGWHKGRCDWDWDHPA